MTSNRRIRLVPLDAFFGRSELGEWEYRLWVPAERVWLATDENTDFDWEPPEECRA